MLPLFIVVVVACCMLPVSGFGCRKLPCLQVTWGKPNSFAATSGAGPEVCEACLSLLRPPSLSLSLSSSGVAFDIDDVFVSFTAQKLCKMQSQQGGRDSERDKHKHRLQAKDVTASNGRVYQVNGYLRHTLTFSTHNLNKNQVIFLMNDILFMVLMPN